MIQIPAETVWNFSVELSEMGYGGVGSVLTLCWCDTR